MLLESPPAWFLLRSISVKYLEITAVMVSFHNLARPSAVDMTYLQIMENCIRQIMGA